MKKRLSIVTLALAAVAAVAQAQSTPREVIDGAPSLPTSQKWAEGDIQPFRDKLGELSASLDKLWEAAVPLPTAGDLQQLQANQQLQQAALNQQLQQNFGFGIADVGNMSEEELQARVMGSLDNAAVQNMADNNRQMAAFASLGITPDDMMKMQDMDDKEGEAFMRRRLAENGYTEADLRRRMTEHGVVLPTEEEVAEDERRQKEAEAQGEAISQAQNTLEDYLEQTGITERLLDSAGRIAEGKLDAIAAKYHPQIEAIDTRLSEAYYNQPMTPMEAYDLRMRSYTLTMDWRRDAYAAWTEFILAAQGALKNLLPYAEASDVADRTLKSVAGTGNAAMDLFTSSKNAINVAAQYLNITASEPE